jgi:hypothetical protein
VRSPAARAYSEWSMAQSWTGKFHRSHSFEKAAGEQMRQVGACLRGLARVSPEDFVAGRGVTDAQFAKAHARCIRNDYYHYVTNSLYGVHLRMWLSAFKPAQILVLETEAMRTMAAEALLQLIADHAGISMPATIPVSDEIRSRCEARSILKVKGAILPMHKTKDEPLDPAVEARLRLIFFPAGTDHLQALNMVLPPQLVPSDEERRANPSLSARAYACARVRCGPERAEAEPRPSERRR